VIVRVPLDEGGLTGSITPETTFEKGDFRTDYFRGDRKKQVQDRVDRLRIFLGEEAVSIAELALRFTLSHPAVSTIIPGMRTAAHVASNTAISDGRHLSPALLKALQAHRWDRNFYGTT
jgi:aryl-alcohol dehydrogenase-like predicted oxidoreductase